MSMPNNVEFIFRAINAKGKLIGERKGFSDDYSTDLERFEALYREQGAVRITADLALPVVKP